MPALFPWKVQLGRGPLGGSLELQRQEEGVGGGSQSHSSSHRAVLAGRVHVHKHGWVRQRLLCGPFLPSTGVKPLALSALLAGSCPSMGLNLVI